MIVYKITNILNGKMYIGQTIHSTKLRFRQHCKPSSKLIVSTAIRKYGKQNFVIEVLEETVCPLVLDYKEQHYIKELNTLTPNGYNQEGGGNLNKFVSLETRKKQRLAHLGKPAPWNSYKRSEAVRKKMSQVSLGKPGYWLGKKRSLINNKKVKCVETGAVYDSCKILAKNLEVSPSVVCQHLKGLKKVIKGFTFTYV